MYKRAEYHVIKSRLNEHRKFNWSYPEMRECFGFTLDQYLYYGGYPGAAPLIADQDRFEQYIQ